MQRAVLLGKGELVAGLGEMIHADVEVSGFEKLEESDAEDFEFFHAFGEMCGEGALLFFQPGNVSVAEERDTIGSEFEDLIHGVREAVGGLKRQP